MISTTGVSQSNDALVHQHGHRQRGHGLGGRADHHARLRRDGFAALRVARAEAAGVDDLVALHHSHGRAGDVELGHGLVDVGFQRVKHLRRDRQRFDAGQVHLFDGQDIVAGEDDLHLRDALLHADQIALRPV